MPIHRSHSIDFKRQLASGYHAGETLHALGRRHDLSRRLIRTWIGKAEAGSLDQDMASAEFFTECEARIAALERLVGRQALEIKYPKGAQEKARPPRSGPASVITGPAASPSGWVRADQTVPLHLYTTPQEKPSDGELVAESRSRWRSVTAS